MTVRDRQTKSERQFLFQEVFFVWQLRINFLRNTFLIYNSKNCFFLLQHKWKKSINVHEAKKMLFRRINKFLSGKFVRCFTYFVRIKWQLRRKHNFLSKIIIQILNIKQFVSKRDILILNNFGFLIFLYWEMIVSFDVNWLSKMLQRLSHSHTI